MTLVYNSETRNEGEDSKKKEAMIWGQRGSLQLAQKNPYPQQKSFNKKRDFIGNFRGTGIFCCHKL